MACTVLPDNFNSGGYNCNSIDLNIAIIAAYMAQLSGNATGPTSTWTSLNVALASGAPEPMPSLVIRRAIITAGLGNGGNIQLGPHAGATYNNVLAPGQQYVIENPLGVETNLDTWDVVGIAGYGYNIDYV